MAETNKKTIPQLLKLADKVNMAEDMTQEDIDKIGQEISRGYIIDEASRKDWKDRSKNWVDAAMQIVEEKTDPWPGCANIKYPVLSIAAIQFNARAYPAIVPSRELVKCVVTGADPDGQKEDRANRVSRHMTWQLRDEMEEWEPDMDKILLTLPIVGSAFKKVYYDYEKQRNVSRAVYAQDLVVNYKTPTLERAPRISEEFEIYPREVKEKQLSGTWLDADIPYEDEETEKLETFIEQHCYIDMDEDGYKEPYIVIIHKDTSKVMRIVANYGEDDLYYKDGPKLVSVGEIRADVESQNMQVRRQNTEAGMTAQQLAQESGEFTKPIILKEIPMPDFKEKVIRITPTEYYVKYGFMPSPDGGIYDMGFGQMLESLSGTIDSTLNQSLDAGSLANLQGGFMARGAKTKAGKIRLSVGEWEKVDTNGMSLRDSIMPFNFQGPTGAMFNLLSFLVDSAKDIANVKDILTGDAPQGETATTSMIKREEGLKVYTAIYKRIWRSLKKELGLLYDLNREFMPPEVYFTVLDEETAVKDADYAQNDANIRPVADPTEAVSSQKLYKAELLMNFAKDPDFDGYAIKKNMLEAMEIPNIERFLPPPPDTSAPDYVPPPPPPEVEESMAKTEKLQAEEEEIRSQIGVNKSIIIKNLADAEAKEAGTQMDYYKTQADIIIKGDDIADRAEGREIERSGLAGVEGQPGDAAGISTPTAAPGG